MILGPLATVRYAVDGLIVGDSVGEPEGVNVGALLGTSAGSRVTVSKPLGDTEGNAVLGTPVLPEPLATVGYAVDGVRVGVLMGEPKGVAIGTLVGMPVGVVVGELVGNIKGYAALGAPVWLEPLANGGYAVDGPRVGEPEEDTVGTGEIFRNTELGTPVLPELFRYDVDRLKVGVIVGESDGVILGETVDETLGRVELLQSWLQVTAE